MKKFREISEQYREEGRHKLIQPKNKPVVSPRLENDSAKVKLGEAIKDKYDIGEYDQEGDMAKSDLRSIIANSKRVHDMLKDDDNLPEWVQSKITKAEDYMSTVANYLEAEMNEAVKMPKQTGAEKEYRRITGKTVDQRLSELDKIQKNLAKQKEDYIKQGIIKAEETEVDESIASTIGGAIGQYTGSKIGMDGPGRAHGELAGRMIDYHARKLFKKIKNKVTGQKNESVELDEGKYGAFKVRMTTGGPKLPRRSYVPQGNSDPRTGLPLGFSNPPKSEKPEDKKMKKEEVELDESIPKSTSHALVHSSSRKIVAKGNKAEMMKKMKELNAKEKNSHHLGMTNRGKVGDTFGEEVESLEEKNVPTSPEKWSRAKAMAKQKFDVYPSAYANGWAAKKYKEMGGGWKSVSEETDLEEGYFKNQEIERQETERLAKKNDVPFKADKSTKQIATPGKYGPGYSAARHLARMGMQKQIEKQKKPVKEEKEDLPFKADKEKKKSVVVGKKPEGYSIARQLARQGMKKYLKPVKEEQEMSRKAKIVKDAMKKSSKEDQFQAEPMISQSIVKNN